MTLQISSSPSTALVITDVSIKDNITIFISHVHLANQPLIKMVHHAVFITNMKVELFAIRYGINQACIKENMSKIIIVTNSIHAVKKIFDSKSHPFQSHTMAILNKLQNFFIKDRKNSIEFWECLSHLKWRFHKDVDKDCKSFNPTLSYPCKTS